MPRLCLSAAAAVLLAAASLPAQVSIQRLLNAHAEPQNWLTYSGAYNGQRFSPLRQIDRANVANLELKWVLQTRPPAESNAKYEATPLIVDGVMYTVQPPNVVVALDAATGRIFWTYAYEPSPLARLCCGRVNRGLAILGDTLFMGTIDGNLIGIDAREGRLKWTTSLGSPAAGYSVTLPPLVVNNKVIAGPAGGEYGIRGFIGAYDPETGKELWRFNTVPIPGEPGHETWYGDSWMQGAAPIWNNGSFDPELNLIYWGTGNPGPDWNGDQRAGDNLYSSSVVALDADTGKLKWHFQFTPHDVYDYDSTQVPVLADMEYQGRMRKLMLFANRNGFFYLLDRATGEFLLAKPFANVTWTKGIDAKGKPIDAVLPTENGTRLHPDNQGATNWFNPSYSPATALFYIPTWMETSAVYSKRNDQYTPGRQFTGGGATHEVPAIRSGPINIRTPDAGYGAIQALDPLTGDIRWQFKMTDVTDGGILSTAADLVFAGGREGYFYALDAKTGTVLWKTMLGGQIAAGPVTYRVDGSQYVSIPSGNAVFTFGLRK